MLKEFRSRNELEFDPAPAAGDNTSSPGPGISNLSKKLRLCYISNPNIIHTRRWVGWFARRGHTVCLLADVPPNEPWLEVPIIDLSAIFSAHLLRFPVWEFWLRRFIRLWRPDVLHAHRVNSAGWLAAFSGFHPCVVTPWGSDVLIAPQRSRIARLLARYTLAHADCVTSISQVMREGVLSLDAKPEHVSSISHGVDLDIFHPENALQVDDMRQALSIPAATPLVFSPRAVHPLYNLDIILRAIPRVLEGVPQACFVFTTYNVEPQYKQGLDRLVADLGLEGSVRWLPPTRDPAEMARRYRSSDVVVSVPSSDGGTPLTVMEAMACGKSVVCSDLPALREFIMSGENGWLVPVRQAEPLGDAILRVLQNPDQSAQFGQKAHQVVAKKANLQVEMQRMEAIYYQLAGIPEADGHA